MTDEFGSTPITQGKARVLTLAIKDKAVLYAAFMSFLEEGGLFIPTPREFKLGEEISLLLSLMDEDTKLSVNARVVWLTPKGAQGNRTAGIGVEFQGDTAKSVRDRIESYLAENLKSDRPTYTM